METENCPKCTRAFQPSKDTVDLSLCLCQRFPNGYMRCSAPACDKPYVPTASAEMLCPDCIGQMLRRARCSHSEEIFDPAYNEYRCKSCGKRSKAMTNRKTGVPIRSSRFEGVERQ